MTLRVRNREQRKTKYVLKIENYLVIILNEDQGKMKVTELVTNRKS